MSKWGSMQWGDVDAEDESKGPESPSAAGGPQVSVFETGPDKEGVKTVTEFHTDDAGVKTKIVRKVKVTKKKVRVNKAVVLRRKWAKFGDAEGLPPGPEKNVTYHSIENINLKLRPKKREDEKNEDALDKLKGTDSIVVCRNCGETGHWTLKCPQRGKITVPGQENASTSQDSRSGGKGGAGGKYVPVHLREGAKREGVTMQRDDSTTIRVTNISEDATEDDLRDLFRPFGHTSRVYLAKDRQTGQSRGFAFISYTTRESGQMAIDKLNGHGYDNLILHVEFAKPREEDPNKSRRS